MSAKQDERRLAPRTDERLPVVVTDAGVTLQAETKNLSAAGVYCVLERFLAPMTKLQLRFALPNGGRTQAVNCSGVVVRVEPVVNQPDQGRYNVAIFFTDLTDRDRAAIGRFVRQRLAAESPAE